MENKEVDIALNQFGVLRALQNVGDEETAIAIMSDPNLDPTVINNVIQLSLTDSVISKDTNKPVHLSSKIIDAGIKNRMKSFFILEDSEDVES